MQEMLHDAFGIPPIHGLDMDADDLPSGGVEGPDEETINFFRLLKEAERELYPGCKKFSLLSFIVLLMHIKCLCGWSNKSFTMLLKLLKDAFPVGEILPDSFDSSRKLLVGLGLDYHKVHACPKDCMVYWGENADRVDCKYCHRPRYKQVEQRAPNEGADNEQQAPNEGGYNEQQAPTDCKIPQKIVRYFPLIPRLKRLFMSTKTAGLMRWHAENPASIGISRHPVDCDLWKHFDNLYPDFAQDPRNVRLGSSSTGGSSSTQTRGRGPSVMHDSWSKDGGKIHIMVNDLGQPIMKETSNVATHVGVLARDSSLLPLIYTDWRYIPSHYKKRVWDEIKAHTDADDSMEEWFMKSLAKKWAGWKAEAKQIGYKPYNNNADRLAHRPTRITESQWRCLVYYWNDRKVQEKSEKNTAVRSKQTLLHTTGRTPHYVVAEKERKKEDKMPSRTDMYIITHTKKNGQPVNAPTGAILEKLKALRPSQQGSNTPSITEERAIFAEAIGPERPGRVRGYGLGVTPSQLSTASKTNDVQRNQEIKKLTSKMKWMEKALRSLGCTFDDDNSSEALPNRDPIDSPGSSAPRDEELEMMKSQMDRMERALLSMGCTFADTDNDSNEHLPYSDPKDASSAHRHVNPEGHQVSSADADTNPQSQRQPPLPQQAAQPNFETEICFCLFWIVSKFTNK